MHTVYINEYIWKQSEERLILSSCLVFHYSRGEICVSTRWSTAVLCNNVCITGFWTVNRFFNKKIHKCKLDLRQIGHQGHQTPNPSISYKWDKNYFIWSHKLMIMHKLQKADCVARIWIGYWLCEAGCIGGIDSLLTYYTNEAQFYFNGHVNT